LKIGLATTLKNAKTEYSSALSNYAPSKSDST
jgi:hypothetical protein